MRWLLAIALLGGCTVAAEPPIDGDPLAPLRGFEDARRAATDFAALPPAERALGPEPVAVARLGADRYAGALTGDDAVVLVDGRGVELSRTGAPALPAAVAVDDGDVVWVGGGASLELRGYDRDGDALRPAGRVLAGEPGAVADIAASGDRLYVADRLSGRVLAVTPATGAVTTVTTCRGPRRLVATAGWLVVTCTLDRSLVVVAADGSSRTIEHDAPLLAVDAIDVDGALVIAAGGLEDHPLDRSDGGFGNIDSYLFVYRVAGGVAERLTELNLSAVDVVMPSAITLARDGAGLRAEVIGTGGGHRAELTWPDGDPTPRVVTHPCPPGISARDGGLAANPLFDSWVALDGDGATLAAVAGADRVPVELRLGEAFYATVAIAPWNDSAGASSRFTCQSCHVDGYSDGRTHFTGRDDVYATTRSIRGLFNNRPHFSRALDRTMTDMVDNEVSVMNRHSGRSPWFTVTADDLPWLRELGVDSVDPVAMRRALMAFLMAYTHAPSAAVGQRRSFAPAEARGAALFADTCERCHTARLSADDPGSRVALGDWEPLVMSERGPIVWGADDYRQTGVEPYVHPAGSRVPSLRRLGRKWPYFTNGTASDLAELLARARIDASGGFRHDGGDGAPLSIDQQADLLAFLRLL